MRFTTLISAEQAAPHVADEGWAFVDCRAVLGQPGQGRAAYLDRHIAGAGFADLDEDLSGPVLPGRTGRHPLPAETAFEAAATRLGIDGGIQVVAYDEQSGGMAAARLWWLLRWAGHDAVAVLDGGLRAWSAADLPCSSGARERPPRPFAGQFRHSLVAGAAELLDSLRTGDRLLLDSRASDRYRGENETIDPVAGHIPGAVSMPYADNVTAAGTVLAPDLLRARFEAVSGSHGAGSTVFYCGSGVTAAHGALAYAHAGLGMPKLYPGSWSEWITEPSRPTATGPA